MVKSLHSDYNFKLDTTLRLVIVDVSGTYTLDNMKEMAKAMKDYCEKVNYSKILVNVTNLTKNVDDMDRYELGVYVAGIFKQQLKLGILQRKDRINYFFETVALNRFTEVKVGDDYDELVTWLCETD